MNYEQKYLKYKEKYENLLNGGGFLKNPFKRGIKRGPKEPCTIKKYGSECSRGYQCTNLELDKQNNIVDHKRTICINKYSIPSKKNLKRLGIYKAQKIKNKDDSSDSSSDDDDESELLS